MILLNISPKRVVNLDNVTHIEMAEYKVHTLSKYAVQMDEESMQNLCSILYTLLPNLPSIFVLPNFVFNMENVEIVSYVSSDQGEIRFTNGNIKKMTTEDCITLLKLFKMKKPKPKSNIDLWFPGKENGGVGR